MINLYLNSRLKLKSNNNLINYTLSINPNLFYTKKIKKQESFINILKLGSKILSLVKFNGWSCNGNN